MENTKRWKIQKLKLKKIWNKVQNMSNIELFNNFFKMGIKNMDRSVVKIIFPKIEEYNYNKNNETYFSKPKNETNSYTTKETNKL